MIFACLTDMRHVLLLTTFLLSCLLRAQEENPLPYVEREPPWDVAPQFPGGTDALMRYLRDSLHYPAEARLAGREGTVLTDVFLDARGRVTNVHIVNGVPGAPSLAREAERLLYAMPNWEPARKKRRRVPAEVHLGVRFRLGTR